MRILIDIGHPAHVHYFRNALKILESNGHEILCTTRDKDVTIDLLKYYDFNFVSTGKNLLGKTAKAYSLIRNEFIILQTALKFKPDILLSFFSPFLAHVGFVLNKPVIAFADSEHASLVTRLAKPFTDAILTSLSYKIDLGKNHLRFNSNMELCYLHKDYFEPDSSVLDDLRVKRGELYFIVRFAAFNSHHDDNSNHFRKEYVPRLIKILEEKGRVLISSEIHLDKELQKYQFQISPEKFHSLIYYSSMYIGESSTSAEEAGILGVPSINFERITIHGENYSFADFSGVLDELQKKYGLVYCFHDEETLLNKLEEMLTEGAQKLKSDWQKKSESFKEEKIDLTALIVWFVENYPESKKILKQDPDYQLTFK
jgi:predicted glycosyltransferase